MRSHKSISSASIGLIGLALLALLCCSSCSTAFETGHVQNGSVSLAQEKVHILNGLWHFYPDQYYVTNSKFLIDAPYIELKVPGVWANEIPAWGIGTYKLNLHDLSPGFIYAIKVMGLRSRGEIYLNGSLLGAWAQETPNFKPRIFVFNALEKNAELIVSVENSLLFSGGLSSPLWIGKVDAVLAANADVHLLDSLLIGGVFMIAMYHFTLFFFRRKDIASFAFGILCLFSVFKAGFSGEHLFSLHLPFLNPIFGFRLAYVSVIIILVSFLHYVYALFPKFKTKVVVVLVWIVSAIELLSAVFFPLHLVQLLFIPYQVVIILLSLYIIFLLFFESVKKNRQATVVLLGFLIIFASALNDIFHDNNLIVTFYSLNLGLFLFLFIQALLLGGLYSFNYHRLTEEKLVLESRLQLRNAEFDLLSSSDLLTGLPNRLYFRKIIEQEWASYLSGHRDFMLAILDLDDFMSVNTKLGLLKSDAVLKRSAEIIQNSIRKVDVASRSGSDQFTILFVGADPGLAKAIMEELRIALASAARVEFPNFSITASYGLCQASWFKSLDELLIASEKEMLRAKREGRNRGCMEQGCIDPT